MKWMELKVPPLVWFFGHVYVMWCCRGLLPVLDFELSLLWSVFFGLAGGAVVLSGVAAFRGAGTTVNPLAPETTSSLVVDGIYRWTRNPMYVGMWLELAAWFCFLQNLLPGLFLVSFVAVMNRLQIVPEERTLQEMFGDVYRDYCRRIPRWLI